MTRSGGPWLVGEYNIPIPSLNYGRADTPVGLLVAKGNIPYVQGFAMHSKSYF